jgi:diadenosine tetraphosphate (Ap4A) HIT family hydrolase
VPETPRNLPDFVAWPSFPFEGHLRLKPLDRPVTTEPPRRGEDIATCAACLAPDDAYIWVSDRWRVRAMDRPTGLPMTLILESRSHLDLGDLPNLLAAELGVMTVRLERAVRSLDGVARVHVNHWGDGSAHLHVWFLARPYGQLQLRGPFLSLWDDILPPVSEAQWRDNLALIAAWLAEFGGRPLAEPPRIDWQAPSRLQSAEEPAPTESAAATDAEPTDDAAKEAAGDADDATVSDAAGNGARPATGATAAKSVAATAEPGQEEAAEPDAAESDVTAAETGAAPAAPATASAATPGGEGAASAKSIPAPRSASGREHADSVQAAG